MGHYHGLKRSIGERKQPIGERIAGYAAANRAAMRDRLIALFVGSENGKSGVEVAISITRSETGFSSRRAE
jgi:hypothetical protein